MIKRLLLWSIILMFLGVAVIANIVQFHRHQRVRDELLDNGFIQSAILLTQSQRYFQRNQMATALSYLSMSSGSLVSLDGPLSREGIHHVAGISMELTKAEHVISDPSGYSESELTAMKSFVRYISQDFGTIINKSHISTKTVQQVIDEAYNHMPEKDRAVLYGDGY